MESLSGGERALVALVELLLDNPNVLVMDEPTNRLDINSREALENALSGFEGTLLCVSHDRYFLDRAIQRLLVIEPPRIKDYALNYSGRVQKTAADKAGRKPVAQTRQAKPQAPRRSAPKLPTGKENRYNRPIARLSVEEL